MFRATKFLVPAASAILVCVGLVAAPSAAITPGARSAESFTFTSTDSDHFSDTLPCGNEPYDVTVSGHVVVHFTHFLDTDTLHVHFHDFDMVVAVPVDGTGPTYRGNFWDQDSDNVRVVKNGDMLVDKNTDLMRAISHGSDGSRVFIMTHSQITVNANGDTTVNFEVDKMICTS
jgi:hypothetical protein